MTNPCINLTENMEEYIIDIIDNADIHDVSNIKLNFDSPGLEVRCQKHRDNWLVYLQLGIYIDCYEYCGQTFLVYVGSTILKRSS